VGHLKIFSRTARPEMLQFTGKLSEIVDIQVSSNHSPQGSDGAIKGKPFYMCLYWKNLFRSSADPTSQFQSNLMQILFALRKLKFLHTVDIFFFFYFESHEQFFSYLATVTITGDKAANLDLCLALAAFSSEGSFTCHTYCDTGPSFLRPYPKDP
jgi:hypothetical protein